MSYAANTLIVYAKGVVHSPPSTGGAIGVVFEGTYCIKNFSEEIFDAAGDMTETRAAYWAILRALEKSPSFDLRTLGREIHILTENELCATTLTLCKLKGNSKEGSFLSSRPSDDDMIRRIIHLLNIRSSDVVYFDYLDSKRPREASRATERVLLANQALQQTNGKDVEQSGKSESRVERLSIQSESIEDGQVAQK
ncbi:hypothetical protein BDZ90DRAFT_262088 [Jaminaea rosea]|uniref:Uncharacterized protein n=1 Tax=Jaminaea rosea TaxID=1569628 RepID=A0A316UKY2_9BASI|nr:hypothetical protein BDZ90DRAFT_262088 [Jaminaea rosea]PWN25890.1 hypothetical protein BDZ90DRAFT_262088 [Jaminaea rosea]